MSKDMRKSSRVATSRPSRVANGKSRPPRWTINPGCPPVEDGVGAHQPPAQWYVTLATASSAPSTQIGSVVRGPERPRRPLAERHFPPRRGALSHRGLVFPIHWLRQMQVTWGAAGGSRYAGLL